jgi:hypothetical protein
MERPDLIGLWRATEWPGLQPAQWTGLIGQARQALLLPRLAQRCIEQGWMDRIPEQPRAYLEGAASAAACKGQRVRWEIDRIADALRSIGAPVVLLKGAAYVAAGLPPARWRMFGDVDVLVPRGSLNQAELELMARGWVQETRDAYDDSYYRTWMHELPPFKHVWRNTWLDLHHAISPPTSRYAVNSALLWPELQRVPDHPGVFVLSDRDLVLHCAVHLLLDGELPHGLRDLMDLRDLLQHFGGQPGFWASLVDRSQALGVTALLIYATDQLQHLFGALPHADQAAGALSRFPRSLRRRAMARLLGAALRPAMAGQDDQGARFARFVLYVRAHAIRMPLHLSLPHLARKAWMRLTRRGD